MLLFYVSEMSVENTNIGNIRGQFDIDSMRGQFDIGSMRGLQKEEVE